VRSIIIVAVTHDVTFRSLSVTATLNTCFSVEKVALAACKIYVQYHIGNVRWGIFELRPEILFGNNQNTSIHGYEHVINSQITDHATQGKVLVMGVETPLLLQSHQFLNSNRSCSIKQTHFLPLLGCVLL
jgi:hypothetical protein